MSNISFTFNVAIKFRIDFMFDTVVCCFATISNYFNRANITSDIHFVVYSKRPSKMSVQFNMVSVGKF